MGNSFTAKSYIGLFNYALYKDVTHFYRSSITSNAAHKAIHNIMQNLLTLDIIKYQNAQALFKFYIDKGMPVTGHSVMTLNALFHKFFSKYSHDDVRNKCFFWLVNGDYISVDVNCNKELLLRLISYDNINTMPKQDGDSRSNDLYDTLFNSNEKCTLFSEFQLEIQSPATNESKLKEAFEVNAEMDRQIHEYFKEKIAFCIDQFEKKTMALTEFMKFINVAVSYLDNTLKCNTIYSDDEIKTIESFRLLKRALSEMYISLENILKSDNHISVKIELLKLLKNILLADLGPLMGAEVRSSAHKEFFICMNKIVITETKVDDDDLVYASDEKEMNSTTLKHNCVLVSEGQEFVLKDESANRTSTVLHCFLALAQTKQPLTQKIITSILQIQKDKSLDKCLVKKVLDKIVNMIGVNDFVNYIDKNIVSVLYFWSLKGNSFNELQVDLLGFASLESFLQKHKKWLISTDILWQKGGDIHNCDFLKKSETSAAYIIEDLTDCNIMLYLCENQPLAIFHVLFSLWKTVLDENVFELKVLALHAFITFLEFVPLGVDSDAFVYNFACKSFAHGINDCQNSEVIKVFIKGAEIVLKRLMPDRVDLIRKSVSQLLAILVIKKEEGFEKDCKSLFTYLVVDMKHYLMGSEDVVDFVSSLSEGAVDDVNCSTMQLFLSKLKTHKLSLNYPSPEMLINLRHFISTNKHYVNALYRGISTKGFSEDCGSSCVHQIVHSLNNILKSTQYDDKSNICQKILPPLVGLMLHCSSERYVDALSTQINNFFSYIWEQTFDSQCEDAGDSQINVRINSTLDIGQKMVVQYMLGVVDFIRLQRSYYRTR
ncbi:putative mutated in ataxia telangiectasia [Operophtera brumata]|uniref:Putative mutated in ataxia telangiectasia n=1 Tax=Operophtera brumata TaxID=104452 RepID=A0A0L7LU19_OPEBR|nr:putative mutated in ataxia telangiectasia [Operophtera brumata]